MPYIYRPDCLAILSALVMGRRHHKIHLYTAQSGKWEAECQHHFGDSIDIIDGITDHMNLLDFLSLAGDPLHIGLSTSTSLSS